MGRVGADLYPLQWRTPLEQVSTFERFVGGFAGNVATGLARLGVSAAIISAVGDEGHGRFVRESLRAEGVDDRWLGVHPTLPTALAFCEIWPPDDFPVTFYRFPTCPDWELRADELPRHEIAIAPLFYATGTGLAREPSMTATLAALQLRAGTPTTVFDLDWREALWPERGAFAAAVAEAIPLADTVIGGRAEYEAAGLDAEEAIRRGATTAVVKRGAQGVLVVSADGVTDVPGLPIAVVNGLGAGDAFAAAYGAALLDGLDPASAARRGNAAGAIVASRLSCSAAMPRRDELERLLGGAEIRDGEVGAIPTGDAVA